MVFRYRCTSWLALATLLLTLVWIVMLVLGESQHGPFNELPRVLAYYQRAPLIWRRSTAKPPFRGSTMVARKPAITGFAAGRRQRQEKQDGCS